MEPADGRRHTLISRYSAWLGDSDRSLPESFPDATIVSIDANVLLALYELSAESRRQAIAALSAVKSQVWVTAQVGLEFSRNRQRVVTDREKRFKNARDQLKSAPQRAAQDLYTAIEKINELRQKNQSGRSWDEKSLGLDKASLEKELSRALEGAAKELNELRDEHDVSVRDVQGQDPLLVEIDELIADRIGQEPSAEELRSLVSEAREFRFPNQIPPGHADNGKPTDLLAAGDFLIWRQLMNQARDSETPTVVFITKETKEDWWLLSESGRALGPQPQLVHEMRNEAAAEFHLLDLPSFLQLAGEKFAIELSDSTVQEVREVETQDRAPLIFDAGPLYAFSTFDFEIAIEGVLAGFGYEILERGRRSRNGGFDLIVRQPGLDDESRTLVEAKRFSQEIPPGVVRSVLEAMRIHNCEYGLIVTNSRLTPAARRLAAENNIGLIEGDLLRQWLRSQDGGDSSAGETEC